MSSVLQLLYRAQRIVWKFVRPRTRGVKVILFNQKGEVLLVRNGYGATHLYVLPGGGVRPWEHPAAAAEREMREELGCRIRRLVPVSTHLSSAEGKRDTVHLFAAMPESQPEADGIELIEARFFNLDALPATISPATARRLSEWRGDAEADGTW